MDCDPSGPGRVAERATRKRQRAGWAFRDGGWSSGATPLYELADEYAGLSRERNHIRFSDRSPFAVAYARVAEDREDVGTPPKFVWNVREGPKRNVLDADATSAQNGYTKHEVLRAAGISVKVEDWGGKMHMKSAVIDGRWVIAGSMNWTAAGDKTNDENTLVIDSPRHARQYTQFYNRIWTGIPPRWGPPGTRPSPESPDSRTACTDGIDNDFDTFVDGTPPQGKSADPGCLQGEPAIPLPPNEVAACVPDGYAIFRGGPASTPRRSAECQPPPDQPAGGGSCDSAYPTVCIAPPPPDLECTDIPHRRFRVLPPDPHRFDGNGDGVGCEV